MATSRDEDQRLTFDMRHALGERLSLYVEENFHNA